MSKLLSWILWRLTYVLLSLCCRHSQIITFDTVELWLSCDWWLKSRMCHIGQPLSEAMWLRTKHISWRQKWNHTLGDWKKWHNLARNKNLTLNLSFPLASLGFSPLFIFLPSSFLFLYEKLTSFWEKFPYKHVMMLWYAFPHTLYFLWLKVLRCVKNYANRNYAVILYDISIQLYCLRCCAMSSHQLKLISEKNIMLVEFTVKVSYNRRELVNLNVDSSIGWILCLVSKR